MDSTSGPDTVSCEAAALRAVTEPEGLPLSPIDVNALRGEEQQLVTRLATQPMDMDTRIDLAWCLFLQAVHQAGSEAACGRRSHLGVPTIASCNVPSNGSSKQTTGFDPVPSLDRRAENLLHECIRHRFVVSRLCRDREILAQAETIGLLLKRFGAEALVRELETGSEQLLRKLCSELTCGTDTAVKEPRFRRLTGH
jgi:hypothetical protein